jgi:hypothetical protein
MFNSYKEIKDFEYEQIVLRRPDGSLMPAFIMVDLPANEKGEIARFLEKSNSLPEKSEN